MFHRNKVMIFFFQLHTHNIHVFRREATFEPSPSAVAQFNGTVTGYWPKTLFYLIRQFVATVDFDKGLIYFAGSLK